MPRARIIVLAALLVGAAVWGLDLRSDAST